MGEVTFRRGEQVPLFNSALETGLRTLVVLDAFYPRQCTVSELTWFDHLVVHTSDLGGPPSLHPDLPSRVGELLVRRRLIDEGLHLLLNANLVSLAENEDGVRYIAGDDAPSFLDLMETSYTDDLKARAAWLCERMGELSEEDLRSFVHARLGRWTLEFQGEGTLHEPSA